MEGGLKKTLLILAMFLMLSSLSFGQLLQLGPGVGYTSINAPESLTKDISDGGTGYSGAIRYGLLARVGLPLLPLNFTGFIYNNSWTGEESGTETSMSLLNIGLGAEWQLLPGPIQPYLALDFLMNSFGDSEINGEKVGDSYSRTGIGLGAGAEFTLLPMINLDASVKYNMNNLFGKEDGEDTMSTLNITVNFLFKIL